MRNERREFRGQNIFTTNYLHTRFELKTRLRGVIFHQIHPLQHLELSFLQKTKKKPNLCRRWGGGGVEEGKQHTKVHPRLLLSSSDHSRAASSRRPTKIKKKTN